MADLLELRRFIRRSIPISPAERAMMARFEAKTGINYVPLGVSGESDEQATTRRRWTGHQFGQSAEFRQKQSQRRQLIRRLVEDRKNGREIADEIGIKVESVFCALSRMRLKILPPLDEPRDG